MTRSGPNLFPEFGSGGGLHEVYARTQADAVCLSGCALMLAQTCSERELLWVRHAGQDRESGLPYPPGLAELGINPGRIVLVIARDVPSVLQAALDGARCSGVSAVVVEFWGEAAAYELTASRRLALAAATADGVVLVARAGAAPIPSAAHTRWQVRAMPSRALPANAPGPPAFEMSLLRARNRQEGVCYCVEWDRDARQFVTRLPIAAEAARSHVSSLSGVVVPLASNGSRMSAAWKQAG